MHACGHRVSVVDVRVSVRMLVVSAFWGNKHHHHRRPRVQVEYGTTASEPLARAAGALLPFVQRFVVAVAR